MRIFLLPWIFLFSSLSHAFIVEGDRLNCKGAKNQFVFLVVAETKDPTGNPLRPRQFIGSYENLGQDEEAQGDVTFVFAENRTVTVWNQETLQEIGSLKNLGRVSFSRIVNNGAKFITLCEVANINSHR